MADISMCSGEGCPKKTSYYRYTTEANPYRQSFLSDVMYNNNTSSCVEFIQDSRVLGKYSIVGNYSTVVIDDLEGLTLREAEDALTRVLNEGVDAYIQG